MPAIRRAVPQSAASRRSQASKTLPRASAALGQTSADNVDYCGKRRTMTVREGAKAPSSSEPARSRNPCSHQTPLALRPHCGSNNHLCCKTTPRRRNSKCQLTAIAPEFAEKLRNRHRRSTNTTDRTLPIDAEMHSAVCRLSAVRSADSVRPSAPDQNHTTIGTTWQPTPTISTSTRPPRTTSR